MTGRNTTNTQAATYGNSYNQDSQKLDSQTQQVKEISYNRQNTYSTQEVGQLREQSTQTDNYTISKERLMDLNYTGQPLPAPYSSSRNK